MRILIVSDTHRRDGNLMQVIQEESPFDMMIHLGDAEGSEEFIPEWVGMSSPNARIEMVQGNNDFFSDLDREREIEIGPYKALITHGHYYSVSVGYEHLEEEALSRGMDIVMYGHTHRPVVEVGEKITVLNPGSLSYPRQEGRRPSYIMMTIDGRGHADYKIHYL